jgi:3-(3-hydroxy-phenyl)propionate hydroxylase/6-hydroxy-3-succinoylpyridine 3-monooxygenase
MTERLNGILIVGAGPSGLLTALGLAQRGVGVTVLEAEPEIPRSPRATVYHAVLLDGLERLGVLADADAAGFRNSRLTWIAYETGDRVEVDLSPASNLHLGQYELGQIALRHAIDAGVDVRFGTRATGLTPHDDRVVVAVDGADEIEAPWVVGADGARSSVRRALGLGFEGTTWPERFVATNIRYPFDERGWGIANFLLDGTHGAIIAKIDAELWRWTWAEPADLPADTVLERFPGRLAAIGVHEDYEIETFSVYRMHQRAVSAMRHGRVLLMGDAAHSTNPTGGLGLAAGLFDCFALVDPLSAAVRGGDAETALDEWAFERRKRFLEFASPMASGLKETLYNCSGPDAARATLDMVAAGLDDPENVRQRSEMFRALESGTLSRPMR